MAYEKQYSDAVRASVETVYGAGFLSPGGAAEVGHILGGLAIEGRDVLDLGCGPGGAAVALAGDLGARRVLGIDVDAGTLERAAETVAAAGLADRITLKLVEPGPLPLPDGSFDVVFSKDVIAHVTDKDTLYGEILRVLRPGGRLLLSDFHPTMACLMGTALFIAEDGSAGSVRSFHHLHGTYLDAFAAAGLRVERTVEPFNDVEMLGPDSTLFKLPRNAARAAFAGMPGALIWSLVKR